MDSKELGILLFGKVLPLEEMMQLTAFYRESSEPDYNDPYMVDRWFDAKGRFQTQAALEMGIKVQPNRSSMPKLPKYDGVIILPPATDDLAINLNRWNWPRLIARAEKLTGRKLSKESVDHAKKKQGYTLPKPGLNEFIEGTVEDFYKRSLAKLWPEQENFSSSLWSIERLLKLKTASKQSLIILADYLMEFKKDEEGAWTYPSEEALNHFPHLDKTYEVIRPERYIPQLPTTQKEMKAALARLSTRHTTNGKYNYLLIALEINNQFKFLPNKSTLHSWLE